MKRSTVVPPYSSGKAEAEQADRGGLFVKRARECAGLVPFIGEGFDFGLHETAHDVAKGFMLGGVKRARGHARSFLFYRQRGRGRIPALARRR
jgi:hypothetical protein